MSCHCRRDCCEEHLARYTVPKEPSSLVRSIQTHLTNASERRSVSLEQAVVRSTYTYEGK